MGRKFGRVYREQSIPTAAIVLGVVAIAFLIVVGIGLIYGRYASKDDPAVKALNGNAIPLPPNNAPDPWRAKPVGQNQPENVPEFDANEFLTSHADSPARAMRDYKDKKIRLLNSKVEKIEADLLGGYLMTCSWFDTKILAPKSFYVRCSTEQAAQFDVGAKIHAIDLKLSSEILGSLVFALAD